MSVVYTRPTQPETQWILHTISEPGVGFLQLQCAGLGAKMANT
jgi:hypothetical protein